MPAFQGQTGPALSLADWSQWGARPKAPAEQATALAAVERFMLPAACQWHANHKGINGSSWGGEHTDSSSLSRLDGG